MYRYTIFSALSRRLFCCVIYLICDDLFNHRLSKSYNITVNKNCMRAEYKI